MKSSLASFISVLGLSSLSLLAADDAPKAAVSGQPPLPHREMRVLAAPDGGAPGTPGARIIRRAVEKREMESVAFLGVETGPVSPTLVAQLGLAEGTGLVLNHLVPDGPAASVLKVHDILLKLDDQILIEQRQLSVLVRNHKEGDEVTVTYLRAGKQATAKIKLTKHDVPKMAAISLPGRPGVSANALVHTPLLLLNGDFDVQNVTPDQEGGREEVNRVLALIDGGSTPGARTYSFSHGSGPGDRSISVSVNTGNSRIISDDDHGSLELTIADGKKSLVAKNQKGEQVFAGPVNTPEERKALPEDIRPRLEKLENMQGFSFRTDADFTGAETKIIRPRGQDIALPARSMTPARQSLSF